MSLKQRKEKTTSTFEDIANKLTAAAVKAKQTSKAPTGKLAKASQFGDSVEDADAFIDAVGKIPNGEPETVRRIIASGVRYYDYVKRKAPELVGESASLEKMPHLIKRWIYDEVLTSPSRTKPNILTMYNDKGEVKDKLYMSESTLNGYRLSAHALIASYIHPHPGDTVIRQIQREVSELCRALCTYFDLARPPVEPNVIYADELRVLLEKLLGADIDATDEGIVELAVMLLTCLYTGCRQSGLTSSKHHVGNYLRWRDVELAPERNDTGEIIGLKLHLTLRHWKGHAHLSKILMRYHIGGTKKRKNLIFDLPSYLFAHGFRNGVLDVPDALESCFDASYECDTYPVHEDFRTEPVFWRFTPGGRSLDKSFPLSSDGSARIVRRIFTAVGFRLPSDPAISLYSIRKGFLTRNYQNPDVGPTLTKQLAGHKADNYTVEENYLFAIQRYDATLFAGLDGEGQGKDVLDPLYLRRQAPTQLTTQQLAELDMELAENLYGETVLATALDAGSSHWKEMSPFNREPDAFVGYDMSDTVALYLAYKKLVAKRIQFLRRQEANGLLAGQKEKSTWKTRAQRAKENAAESRLTSDLEAQHLKAVLKQRAQVLREDAGENGEIELIQRFDEEALDGEDGQDDEQGQGGSSNRLMAGLDAGPLRGISSEIWPKFLYIKRLVTPKPNKRACDACLLDPTTSKADREKLYNHTQLEKHLKTKRDLADTHFHAPLKQTLRWLKARGMDRDRAVKQRQPLDCTLGGKAGKAACSHVVGSKTQGDFNTHLLRHIAHDHPGVLPAHLDKWLKDWYEWRKGKQRDATKTSKASAIPRRTILSHQAAPALPISYVKIRPKGKQATIRYTMPSETAVRQLLSPSYSHPASADPTLPVIPTAETAANDIEKYLVKRMEELRPHVPDGLFGANGWSLELGEDPYTLLDSFTSDVMDEITDKFSTELDGVDEILGALHLEAE